MRSNYKRLGDYIEPCNEKNTGNLIKELRGISNQKFFQKAKTNTIGIDLSKYRVVRTGQFAFNRATTRNGDKISIALREKEDCIVSPSYRMFKSKDENVLNSEYLMMWFRRPEFDRYARFKSHGSAHEFFDLDEMYEVELPIPSIEKQRAIVKEYNTIVNRIKLNEQLNQKLEETAQALYKHWFVDFEFPNENGQPYKSSGGEMVYNEELDQEIPLGWILKNLSELVENDSPITYGVVKPGEEDPNGVKLVRSGDIKNGKVLINDLRTITIEVSNEYKRTKLNGGELLIAIVGNPGEVAIAPKTLQGSNIARQVAVIRINSLSLSLFVKNTLCSDLGKSILKNIILGSVQEVINLSDLRDVKIPIPTSQILDKYTKYSLPLHEHMEALFVETGLNIELKEIVLARMSKSEKLVTA